MLTHGNLRAEVDMATQTLDHTPGEIALGVLPMAHLFGMPAALIAPIFNFRSVVHRWFIPDEFLKAVEEHRITNTALVPTMLTLILNSPQSAGAS